MDNPTPSTTRYFHIALVWLGRIVLLFILLSIIFPLIPIVILLVSLLPPFQERYYADYNQIKAQLEQLPNTQIVDSWTHEDLTLEDFGFTLRTPNCPLITINFRSVHESRWYENFEHIDGIVLLNSELTGKKPPQPSTMRLSRQELDDTGLRIQNIEDVIIHLAPLLRRLNEQPARIYSGVSGLDSAYIHLSYPGGFCTTE